MTSLAVPPPDVPGTSSCSMCPKPAIYTCPGCTARTCSASCSSAHKTKTACTGTRNRAAYVPMNNYSLGSLMNDYTFLEDVGRKVGQWGQEIVRERLVDEEKLQRSEKRSNGSSTCGTSRSTFCLLAWPRHSRTGPHGTLSKPKV
jgi:hypothetical protein